MDLKILNTFLYQNKIVFLFKQINYNITLNNYDSKYKNNGNKLEKQ